MMKGHGLFVFYFVFICSYVSSGQLCKADVLLDSINNISISPSIEETISIFERLNVLSVLENNRNTLAHSLNGLSLMRLYSEDYVGFESALEEYMNVAIDTAELGLEHYSTAISSYATLSQIKGDRKRSIELGLKSIEIEKMIGGDHEELGILYHNISSNYRIIGDYNNALNFAYKASEQYNELYRLEPKLWTRALSTSHLNIAYCLIDLEKWNEALNTINKGVNVLEDYQRDKNKDFRELTIDFYLRRVQINLKLNAFDNVLKDLDTLENLQKITNYRIYNLHELYGEYYSIILDSKKSIAHYDLALSDAMVKYAESRLFPVIARIYNARGNVYAKMDSINEAFTDFQNGLGYFDDELDNNWDSNPDIQFENSVPMKLELLISKANFARDLFSETLDTKYLKISKVTYRSAMDLMDDMRLGFINEDSKYYIVAKAQALYQEYLALLVFAKDHFSEDEWSSEIYNTIQRNKNSVLVERIRAKVVVLASNLPIMLKKQEAKLRSDVSLYTKLLSELNKSDSTSFVKMKSYKESLFKAKEDFAIFRNKLKLKYPEYYELANTTMQYHSVYEINNSLSSGQAIIEYFATDSGFVSIIINDTDVQVDVYNDKDVFKLLSYYIESISQSPKVSGVTLADLTTQSEQIFTMLLGRISGLKDIDQLYIIPDGVISKLAFASLIDPETKKYLLSDKSISYLVSVDQFVNQENHSIEENLILGISPTFSANDHVIDGQCNGSDLSELAYAVDELSYLQTLYEGSYIIKSDASITSFIDNVNDFSIIHLATHACLNTSDPMLSQIFFSDGSLTNYDLQNLNINPELVVLAACNTAQGEIQKGEGVISLSRGFFEAGVQSLISSLWAIDDYSSSVVVKGMYTHLKDGKSKSESLRQAKLDYLASADKLRSHPYYWAGLVQIGDSRPIISSFDWLPYVVVGLLVFFSAFIFIVRNSKRKSL